MPSPWRHISHHLDATFFVFSGTIIGSLLIVIVAPLRTPLQLIGLGVAVLFAVLCVIALVRYGSSLPSPEEQLEMLKRNGLLTSASFRATRAFRVDEYGDEGLHYFIELEQGAVLFLSGQYLYNYEPINDDPELNQARQFPCTEFRIVRHKLSGDVYEMTCSGKVFEPEMTAQTFSASDYRAGKVPEDGQIITDRSYEAIKQERQG